GGEHCRLANSNSGEAEVVGALGYVAREEGEIEDALELFVRAAELADQAGFLWWEVGMLAAAAESLIALDRVDEAEPMARRHLELAREIGDRQHSLFGVGLGAWIAARPGNVERAHLLWGAVEAEERRGPVGQRDPGRASYPPRLGL